MRVLLIGSGGREHAMARLIAKSPSIELLYSHPGNPGIFNHSKPTDIGKNLINDLPSFCKTAGIDLVVIGPEQPLAEGITDVLLNHGIKVFGPCRGAARLESSKEYAKQFMQKYNIPTAGYASFGKPDMAEAEEYVRSLDAPVVLKADGLAAGKGVVIATSHDEAIATLRSMFGGAFGAAGDRVVIEEFLSGEEASVLAVSDGQRFVCLAPSQDHKRVSDGDLGANTGGMGAYAPAPIVDRAVIEKVKERIIQPALLGMKSESTPFVGCLYAGLMIDRGEPKVVEFNVRFGDPETQAVLPLFEGDFARLLYSAASGSLDLSSVESVDSGCACCVVLASGGYPGSYGKGYEITGIEQAEQLGAIVYHAGTAIADGRLVTAGGRVLGVTSKAGSLGEAISSAYSAVEKISFRDMFYRRDIGKKGLR